MVSLAMERQDVAYHKSITIYRACQYPCQKPAVSEDVQLNKLVVSCVYRSEKGCLPSTVEQRQCEPEDVLEILLDLVNQ
jgi:hypothetical protein